ncbi:MAG TPA: cyclase family protein [Thermoanaerobaculia bacterium]|nr:cyclase family protein [Thermoanaerobaculia bacterium]
MKRTLRILPLALVLAAASAFAQGGPPKEDRPFREPDLVEIVRLDPTIRLDVRYATANNLLRRPVYSEARAFLQRPAAEALVRVNRVLKEKGYGLLVFDGYRPWSVTKLFWDATPAEKKIFVADPKKGSRHNRGCAVDLSLYELATGREADMGGAYDEMSARSYPTWDKGSKDVLARRALLAAVLESEGFFEYPAEWWHFDYKDWLEYPILDVPFTALAAPRAAFAEVVNLRRARVVDLTHTFDEKTLYWPTSPSAFELKTLFRGKTDRGFFYESKTFSTPEHGGTHLDAPVHFSEQGASADQVPVRRLIAPAVILDVSAKAEKDPDYGLTISDVRSWEAAHGTIPRGAIVLLRTGWSARWPDRKRYLGDDTPNDASHLHFPSYGPEAAEFLVKERAVGALGVDTASIDHGPSADFPVHRVAAAAQVPGLENLANLGELPETGAWLVALPMKIGSGSGGPLRVVALVGD